MSFIGGVILVVSKFSSFGDNNGWEGAFYTEISQFPSPLFFMSAKITEGSGGGRGW